MSDSCPKCGEAILSQHGIHDDWSCGSHGWDGVVCFQSDKCRIRELEQVIVKAAIPLEALRMTECDEKGFALSASIKTAIVEATDAIRAAIGEKP